MVMISIIIAFIILLQITQGKYLHALTVNVYFRGRRVEAHTYL